jgi:hypothetical protein
MSGGVYKIDGNQVNMPKIHERVKVIIPSKEEVERMDMAGAHFHFNQRLNERYGIEVTIDEYMVLRRENIEVCRKEKHKIVGIMKIKGVDVLVVREKHKKKKLITALPFHNYKTTKKGEDIK